VDEKGDKQFAHTVNDTGCAMGRMLIMILDNYQQKDGSVAIPKDLRKWVGKDMIEVNG
jgi:seryl-tRNA synthetase